MMRIKFQPMEIKMAKKITTVTYTQTEKYEKVEEEKSSEIENYVQKRRLPLLRIIIGYIKTFFINNSD